jgi:hypothetical protein
MATTRSLNLSDSVYCTTFAGKGGRNYTFTANYGGMRGTATFTEAELFSLLASRGSGILRDDGKRPDFTGR